MKDNGLFITFEGIDGAGKSTQLKLLAKKAEAAGLEPVCTREPGGTSVSNAVRGILLDPVYSEMTPLTETFLYAAARAQLFHQVIAPALNKGKLVICDRFIDSSLAYQGYAGGLEIEFILNLNMRAVQNRLPDRTFILDLLPHEGLSRCGGEDRMERKDMGFHQKVRQGFKQIAFSFPDRVTVIDAARPAEEIIAEIWQEIAPLVSTNS